MNDMHPLCVQLNEQIQNSLFNEAVLTANKLVEINPMSDSAYYLMGYALKQSQQFKSAIKCYDMSLAINSDQPHLYLEKGEVHHFLGDKENAFPAYTNALELSPNDAYVLQKVGGFLLDCGHLEESKLMLDKALELGNQFVLEELLDWHERNADIDELEKFISNNEQYWAHNAANLSLANAYLSQKKYEKTVFYLKSISVEDKPLLWQRAYYNLLAQSYEKLRLYDNAFASYQAQNEQTHLSYSPQQMEDNFQFSITTSESIRLVEKMETSAVRNRWKPVFIVGLPRTGSTLLEKILTTSTQFLAGGELAFVETAFNDYVAGKKSLIEASTWYQEKIEFLIKEQGLESDIPLWVSDKMPTNFVYIGFIKAMFPNAKFLYCKRHPMDVGLSIYKQNFNQAIGYANNFNHIAHFMALEDNIMQHWLGEFSSSIYTVEYEQLVSDFDAESKNIFNFLNIKWGKQVELFYKNTRFAKTASYKQVRDPINTQNIAQYVHYMPYLQDFYNLLDGYKLLPEQEQLQPLRSL